MKYMNILKKIADWMRGPYVMELQTTPGNFKEFEALRGDPPVLTRVEVLNSALTLLNWYAEQYKNGRTVGSIDPKTEKYREVVLDGVPDAVRRHYGD